MKLVFNNGVSASVREMYPIIWSYQCDGLRVPLYICSTWLFVMGFDFNLQKNTRFRHKRSFLKNIKERSALV